ncbi:MAG TPA: acetyl-CoA carboxylase biotin carboxyl carrier protein subunit [Candidatus Marinimicrobia bacterium]|nr:acetyl-CoA carboxylase biotin carboxyl carrier protein subunit [Candidatus Neomarinimicrobiota bacterium]
MREKTLQLEINNKSYSVTINEFNAYEAVVTVNDKTYTVGIKDLGIELVSDLQSKAPSVATPPIDRPATIAPTLHKPKTIFNVSTITAPLPGLILKISVKEGDIVKTGQDLIVMEAMKMENEIQTPKDGKVKSILVKEGDSVNEGDILIEME